MKEKLFTPEQANPGYPGARPPKGWVPPLDAVMSLMGVYDNKTGFWVGLPLQALIEGLSQAEQLNALGKIDSRQAQTLTIPSGTGAGVYATRKQIEVPASEVWFLSQLQLDTPAQSGGIILANVRISNWLDSAATPDTDGLPFWATDRGGAIGGSFVAECYSCAPAFVTLGDGIGAPLRLPPGSKLTICAQVTVGALGADRVVTLTPFGWKGKLLAPAS
ncbi:MAG: hypothetical protein PHQ43_08690 [Dehalococcoidales bacterium]|nr:hypothetical protein [Dehalococcoidales bacterium]